MKLLSTIDWLQSKPPRDTQTSVNSVGGWGSGVEFVVYVNPTPSSLLSPLLCLCPRPLLFLVSLSKIISGFREKTNRSVAMRLILLYNDKKTK